MTESTCTDSALLRAEPAAGEIRGGPAGPPALGEAAPWPAEHEQAERYEAAPWPAEHVQAEPREPAPEPLVDSGRPGPLAELLFKEGVSALRAELGQRSAEVARLRGALADATSELEARTAVQASLRAAHDELRDELSQLIAAVGDQRSELQRRIAELEGRAEAVEAERDELRAELADQRAQAIAAREQAERDLAAERERVERDLAAERERASGALAQLRRSLASARVARDAAAGEATGLRAELERFGAEVAAAREQTALREGNLAEAQLLLAEARALTRELRRDESDG